MPWSHLHAFGDDDWASLVKLAKDQAVCAMLYHRLHHRCGVERIPQPILDALHRHTTRITAYNLRLVMEMSAVAEALNAKRIPVILLKGGHLLHTVYSHLPLRETGDIDLMVEPEALFQAGEILAAQGYRPMRDYPPRFSRHTPKHLPRFVKNDSVSVEVHWHIVDQDILTTIPLSHLWQRAVPIGGTDVKMKGLSPEDLLLHLCLHTSSQHLFTVGIRPFCDICEIIRYYRETLDWKVLLSRSLGWGCRKGVFLSLYMAKALFGASVPDRALQALKPGSFNESVVATVLEQLFSHRTPAVGISHRMARILSHREKSSRMRAIIGRVLLHKEKISYLYGVPCGSWRVYLYYVIRIKDLFIRHGKTMWRVITGDSETTQTIERRASIARWLDAE